MSELHVVVSWSLCEGNGACADEAPEVFEMDDLDNLLVLQEHPPPELRDKVEAAVRVCPKRALRLEQT